MHTGKPLIGMTCNYDYRDIMDTVSSSGPSGRDWNTLSGDYIYSIERSGGCPVLIPRCEELSSLAPLLESLDGLLLTGGQDIGPGNYGAFTKSYCGIVSPMRDKQELALTQFALSRDLPLLGICRGMQLLNVALGGTLYQDLEVEGGFECHSCGRRYPRNVAWHSVTIEDRSRLKDIFGSELLQVNSYHHQAVRTPGTGVRVTAYSSDGVPEAIEVENHRFMIAVQWHPEMMYDSAEHQKLVAAFVEACRSRQSR